MRSLVKYISNLTFLLLLIVIISCINQTTPDLVLSDYSIQIDSVREGSVCRGEIKVWNKGEQELHISNISTDCSCTDATIDKTSICKGDTSRIYYSLNTSHKYGDIENYIFIEANTDSAFHFIQIKAHVYQ